MTQSRETSACELQALALREGWDFDLADQAHLRRGAASSLSADDAGELFCALSGPHDFWWPLVVGTRPLRNVLVLEDTWGSLAVRLSEIADRVCALFLTEPDASLLRRSRVATNVEVHVAATLVSAPLWQEKWDLIVLQRPAATDLGELRRCAVRSLSENGSVVIVDEFRATASTALFKGEGERVRWSEFNDLRQPSHAYVSHAPIRAQLMNLPDLRLRRSRTCAGAAIEGTREHGLRRRALLNYVRPVSVLAVSHRADTYVRQILDADRIRALSPGEPMIVKRLLAGNEDTTVMLVGSKSDSDCKVVLRAAYRARARRRVQHNADVLKSLAQFKLPFAVPALLATFEDSPGVFISAESCLPGAVLLSVSAGQAKQAYMRRAIEKWNLFRSAHAVDSAVGNDDYVRLIGTAFEKIQRYTSREDENR
ncbi:MAG TPA: hypothetical protein VFS24_16400, partial [Steroidobacteraceae bacterium]|nr:hypothetical protein [Steroidobacteraceae bacterium]